MNRLPLAIILMSFLTTPAFSNDLYLRTGYVYRNVSVDTSGAVILVDMGSRIDTVQKSIVLLNTSTAYHNQGTPRLTLMTADEEKHFNQKSRSAVLKPTFDNPALTPRVERPNLGIQRVAYKNTIFIALGVLGAAIAWERFATASGPPGIERTRSYIIGAAAAATGLAFTIYALTPVEVTVSTDRVNLSYKF